MHIPQIIQGGMGAAVSHWRLAQAVSKLGQLGVVSGTALDQVLVRRLQEGDPTGDIRRALDAFPFRTIASRILKSYFVPGGIPADAPYATTAMHTHARGNLAAQELCIAGNFTEIFLAREGHGNPVGINYLEKIQLPHLPSLYGAMLAGVAVVIIGAGIPMAIPAVIEALANHKPATYPLNVTGAASTDVWASSIDPKLFHEGDALPELSRPAFLPIVASNLLATMMVRRASGPIDGFVIEGPTAGGHNAPPRGGMKLSDDGQPIYGQRDVVDLQTMKGLGLPFWLAGGYGSHERFNEALANGAAGIQVGTAFALCMESGLTTEIRRALIQKALAGTAVVRTDPLASPTGFPFKVALLDGTLTDKEVYLKRNRICQLGFLREAYLRPDGTLGYRCPAEPIAAYTAKGGNVQDTAGRVCLCNALIANVGMPQRLQDGTTESCMITLGDDLAGVGRFCKNGNPDFTAADVIKIILGTV
jgi:nitronate monooxygenase